MSFVPFKVRDVQAITYVRAEAVSRVEQNQDTPIPRGATIWFVGGDWCQVEASVDEVLARLDKAEIGCDEAQCRGEESEASDG